MTVSVHDNHGWKVTFHDVTLEQSCSLLKMISADKFWWDRFSTGDYLDFDSEDFLKCIKTDEDNNTIDFA